MSTTLVTRRKNDVSILVYFIGLSEIEKDKRVESGETERILYIIYIIYYYILHVYIEKFKVVCVLKSEVERWSIDFLIFTKKCGSKFEFNSCIS